MPDESADPSLSQSQQFSLIPRILNGAIAGVIGVSITYPLDVVKTLLQNQKIGPNGERMYKNMSDCFWRTYQARGYFGMYRGFSVNATLISPAMAVELASNDFFRYHLTTGSGTLPLFNQMIAGGLAGAVQIIVSSPMDLLKIRMQSNNTASKKRKTATQIAYQLIKEKGIFGLFKGASATVFRDVLFSMIYYPIVAAVNKFGQPKTKEAQKPIVWCTFLAGLTGGCLAAWIVNPLDVVKTRLQALHKFNGKTEIKGIRDGVSHIIRKEGLKVFWMGALCRVIVIAPLSGIIQMVYFLGIAESLIGLRNQ